MFLRNYQFCIYFSCFAVFTASHATPEEVFAYMTPDMCTKNEYFDVKSLTCVECDATKNLQPSLDHLACTCNRNSKYITFEHGYPICEACGPGEISTVDGLECIACAGNSTNDTCKCYPNEIRIERNLNGTLLDNVRCLTCPDGSYPSPDGSTCLKCRINSSNTHNRCPCPLISHTRVQQYCVNKIGSADWQDIRSTYSVKYRLQEIDSYYFRTKLQLIYHLCKNDNKTACEELSNMCALTLYTSSTACKSFLDKNNPPLWLYYSEGEAPTVLNRENIPQKYSLDRDSSNNRLNITFARFSLDGKFLSMSSPSTFCEMFTNVRFGMNIEKYCKLNTKQLMNIKMEFYEPYLEYGDGNGRFLYALPVSIKSMNRDPENISKWLLVRKFFFVDTITGFKAISNSLNGDYKQEDRPTVIRYVKSVHLRITVRNKAEQGKIYPPLIILDYGELTREDIDRDVEVTIDYKITYILTDNDMYNAIEISCGVLSSLAIVYSAIKAWSYCKRNGTDISNVSTILWFLIFACGILANVFMFVLFSASLYTLVFYKGQTVLHVLLPSEEIEENIRMLTIVAFSLKLVDVLALVYRHRNIDVFFIDWEQPRCIQNSVRYDSPRTSLKKLYANRFPAEQHTPLKSSSEIISARRNKTPMKSDEIIASPSSKFSTPRKQEESNVPDPGETSFSMGDMGEANNRQKLPVSIWRTYVIANEWLKMQTSRKINMLFQGIVMLFVLEVLEIKFLAQPDPDFTIRKLESSLQERENFSLKFAVGISVYVLVYCAQWLVYVTLYERYVKNRIHRFVDLCSMANMSVFILAQHNYGFYIHGRSVHGFADTDLATLIDDLIKEEEDLCAHRGLLPGTTEQSFVISVSATFRAFYDKILTPVKANDTRFLRKDVIVGSNFQKNVQAYHKMKQFLTQFLDHCFKDLDYVIGEKQFLEKLLDIEYVDAVDRSIFYPDHDHSFDRVMFYGNEWTLTSFEVTLFIFTAALSEGYTLATIVTVFVSQFLIVLRKFNEKRELASKTMIDERFLL